MTTSQFTVIIVGGGIAGLTLAHCLRRVNINHIVLEKSSGLSPQVGASIGILPNGGRILNQLSLYEHIEQFIEPLDTAHITFPDGFSFSSRFPRLLHEQFGYPIAFFDRQKLLEVLHTQYPDQSRILTSQRVTKVRPSGSRVEVITEAGEKYTGDIVVGADHSKVRSEMWRIADAIQPGLVTQSERNSTTTEYCCIFGISSCVPTLEIGDQINTFHDNLTLIIFIGKNKRAFWFVVKKLDRKYTYPDRPRFDDDYMARLCEQLSNRHLTKDLTFGQVWSTRVVASMTALEENVYRTWFHGRIVCIGDSVHKMTPNIGQGANLAIEDAAVLANLLHAAVLRAKRQRLSDSEVQTLLQENYYTRYSRVKSVYTASRYMVRFQARDGLLNKALGRYVVPFLADVPALVGTGTIRGGPTVNFLPLPEKDGPGWKRHKSRAGVYSAMFSILLLAIAIYMLQGE
ncbi:hypothetical protein AbraIFM66951_002409 [Aspergillus brasiliensis]|uniref:FAD-binding domain-containing protein n=1 Tax=Aspergillus brasiliensis TaxID=319629 RepID=A0A9W5YXU3_9EURO|nr:hypothetical protein AbraCBS73388_001565 [Aspergillus brasiliensis]GKZ49705.1 hypothetical protein AbraIFM66951_002409 [Aspergillus brasiliensis]